MSHNATAMLVVYYQRMQHQNVCTVQSCNFQEAFSKWSGQGHVQTPPTRPCPKITSFSLLVTVINYSLYLPHYGVGGGMTHSHYAIAKPMRGTIASATIVQSDSLLQLGARTNETLRLLKGKYSSQNDLCTNWEEQLFRNKVLAIAGPARPGAIAMRQLDYSKVSPSGEQTKEAYLLWLEVHCSSLEKNDALWPG